MNQLVDFINANPIVIMPFVAVSIVLKGFSLWKAARASMKYWFVALLTINTMGILEAIFLLFIFRKRKDPGQIQ